MNDIELVKFKDGSYGIRKMKYDITSMVNLSSYHEYYVFLSIMNNWHKQGTTEAVLNCRFKESEARKRFKDLVEIEERKKDMGEPVE